MSKVLELRRDKTSAYSEFVEYLLSAVIGKKKYREKKAWTRYQPTSQLVMKPLGC